MLQTAQGFSDSRERLRAIGGRLAKPQVDVLSLGHLVFAELDKGRLPPMRISDRRARRSLEVSPNRPRRSSLPFAPAGISLPWGLPG